jgi:hypothetical protein
MKSAILASLIASAAAFAPASNGRSSRESKTVSPPLAAKSCFCLLK